MTWQLHQEMKEYNGYKLQKATTDFGGRSWNAWFSNEINIKEGPYKFRGLPGLIFILEDSDQNFIYKVIHNEKLAADYDTKEFLETHYGKPAIPISNEKFNKYVENIYQNPTRMFSEKVKNGGNVSFKNESIESAEELNKKKKCFRMASKEGIFILKRIKNLSSTKGIYTQKQSLSDCFRILIYSFSQNLQTPFHSIQNSHIRKCSQSSKPKYLNNFKLGSLCRKIRATR